MRLKLRIKWRFNKTEAGPAIKLLRNSVLIMFLIVFVSLLYNYRNKTAPTETALMSEAVASKEFRGVFIRSEKPVTYSGSGVLSYKVADGGKVGSGTVIAEVYPDEQQIMLKRQIAQKEKELAILKKIQNPGTLEAAQPGTLSENIAESYRSLIYSRDMNDYDAVKNELEDLVVGMSTYQIITKQVTGFGQQIIDLNNEIAQLRSGTVLPTETIKSNGSAYFASYCDGYEAELSPKKLDVLTAEEINSISDRRSDDPTIVGKMIDGYSWYLAGVIDNTRKEYAIGNEVELRFESSNEKYEAVIKDIRYDSDPASSVIIVECSRFSKALVEHRSAKCELIKGEYKGLKVPREAIRFLDRQQDTTDAEGNTSGSVTASEKGVYIMKGEQKLFKKIDVIYEGSDYVLSRVHDEDGSYLALYDDIMTEGE